MAAGVRDLLLDAEALALQEELEAAGVRKLVDLAFGRSVHRAGVEGFKTLESVGKSQLSLIIFASSFMLDIIPYRPLPRQLRGNRSPHGAKSECLTSSGPCRSVRRGKVRRPWWFRPVR